jgi:hypothetical protein
MNKKRILPLLPTLFLATALLGLLLFVSATASGQAVVHPARANVLPPVSNPDGRLGVCYAFYEDETLPPYSGQRPYLDLVYDAGARHDRWDFSWTAIQPNNQDQWLWDGHEEIVQIENAKGMDVLGILLWTPEWAATNRALAESPGEHPDLEAADARFLAHTQNPLSPDGPTANENRPPRNLDQPVFVAGQINRDNYWGHYVYNVAKNFDGSDPTLRVDAWEIWNEPEWDFFWTGTTQDYCQLLKVGYKAIKGEDGVTGGNPAATVVFGGLHYWDDPSFYKAVLDCLAADPEAAQYNYYFDVMSVHFYSRSDNTYDRVNEIKSEMATRGMSEHPIWLTETGAPIYGDTPYRAKGDYFLSADEEAAYVLQSYPNALAAGVERYYFFRAHDADVNNLGAPFGLIRNDKTLRPAYTAYQVAAKYLKGENQVTRVSTTENTRVSLWGTPRGKISVLWNRTPNPMTYTVEAAMPTATLIDRWGVTQTVTAANGYYTLPLPVATANLVTYPDDYVVGGDPLILIETDTVSPTSNLNPLPARTHSIAVDLTWTASDADSGIWYTEIQSSTSPSGPWATFAGWSETQGVTETVYRAQQPGTVFFRARTRDRVGNWEAWPASFEVSTTVDADIFTEFHWQVDTLYNDSNRNGVWDRVGTGSLKPEITLTHVSMRFVDEEWRTIASVISDSWRFTQTLPPGSYSFVAEAGDADGDGWIYLESWDLDGTIDPLYAPATTTLGLLPREDIHLPILLKTR